MCIDIEEAKERVAKATVHLPGKGGQGVLVPGDFILTATHCMQWNGNGHMALGDSVPERIETKTGAVFRAEVYAAESVNDITVLGVPNGDAFDAERQKFTAFCKETPPVPVSTEEYELFELFPVHILSHKGIWISAQAQQTVSPTGQLCVESHDEIEGGTSGGPVIDNCGQLVGLVSVARAPLPSTMGMLLGHHPRPCTAIPGYLWTQISEAMKASNP